MNSDPLVDILIKDFERRKMRNNAYSLRGFSRDLGVDPSNLSKVLNQRKKIGPELRIKLARHLGFEDSEIEGRLKPLIFTARDDKAYNNHELRIFEIVSDWQHYAILEYLKLKSHKPEPCHIAEHLGLTIRIVDESIKRLLQVGLLEKTGKGLKLADSTSSSILNIATSRAHRELQNQILEGAIEALKNTPIEIRSQSSMTIAIDSRNIEKAKILIKAFRRDMGLLLSSSTELDSVYQLSISLYPLTKTKNKENKNETIYNNEPFCGIDQFR